MTTISEIFHQGPSINKASKAAILLHGRGGSAQHMLRLANKLCNEKYSIIAPQAAGRSWYPQSFLAEETQNEPYLSLSVASIKDLIDQIAKHLPKEQIFIIGFSQGACLALEVSARFPAHYGGIIAFTGGLIGKVIDEKKYQGKFEGAKVYMSNGDQDPHVPLIRSQQSKELMEKLGAQVTLQIFKGRAHTISDEEVRWVKANMM